VLIAISPTDFRILFTNYDIITYFLNLASCSEHFISIKHRILATFNINQKKSIQTACMPLSILYFYWRLSILLVVSKNAMNGWTLVDNIYCIGIIVWITNYYYTLLYNIYIAHYITITLSVSHYKTIKIIHIYYTWLHI
jgi:hypothetical protein